MAKITEKEKLAAEHQIKERQRELSYDIRDFTVELLVSKFGADEFYVPPYQRQFVWTARHKNRFIESLLLGLPIPFMFVADMEDGRMEIVDGAQRIQTLEAFLSGDFSLSKLERLPKLEGFYYSDLPLPQQRKLNNRALRIVVLEEFTAENVRQEIFNRINTSGKKATPAEVRRGAHQGPFMSFISRCSQNPLFKKLCPLTQKMTLHRQDEEMVLRFFAYSDRYQKFSHDVDKFLDKFVADHRNTTDTQEMEREFEKTLRFVARYFSFGFAKNENSKSTPRVRFEAIAVGVNLALRKKPSLVPAKLTWLDSDEFANHTTTHASNSKPRLKGRVEYVRDMLLAGGR